MPYLRVPGEVFGVYQPVLGHLATMLWLNMRYAAETGREFSLDNLSAVGIEAQPSQVRAALAALSEYELIESDEEGFVVHDPLTEPAFRRRFQDQSAQEQTGAALRGLRAVQGGAAGRAVRVEPSEPGESHEEEERATPQPALPLAPDQEAPKAPGEGAGRIAAERRPVVEDEGPSKERASSGAVLRSPLSRKRKQGRMLKLVESAEEPEGPENPDMQAVVQIYHKHIGMLGPTQYEKLRFWVEEQGMEGAVVALAIEETVRSADVPRISYLEGILRNWYNDGIRTLADVQEHKRASKVLSGGRDSDGNLEGMPNASAYQSVSSDLVAKWKEMYPDEYDR